MNRLRSPVNCYKATGALFCLVLLLTPLSRADLVKVVLLGGQSNMDGRAATSGLPTSPVNLQNPQPDVLFYEDSFGLTTLRPGSGSSFGPEVTFGRTTADVFPSETFCLIKYAAGATSLASNWDPNTGGTYASFRTTVSNGLGALSGAGHTYEIVGMLWTQGERDAKINRTTIQYEADLNAFIADVRTRYGADLPFFLSRLSANQTDMTATQLSNIRTAQDNVAAADAFAWSIDTDAMSVKTDNLHFDAAGQIALGEAFAQRYVANIAGAGSDFWSGEDTADITTNTALVSATVSTNLDSVVLVWGAEDQGTSSTNAWAPNILGLGATNSGPVVALITNLVPDTQYTWRFYGEFAVTNAWSASAPFATAFAGAQTPVFTNAAAVSSSSITLGWQDNASNETGYILQRSVLEDSDYETIITLGAGATSHTDMGLSASNTYFYQLAATNGANGSATVLAAARTNAVTSGNEGETHMGLLAHYPFDQNFNDTVGANHLTIGGGSPAITTEAGEFVFGGALDLDQSAAEYLSLTSEINFGTSDAWSVSCWARRRVGAGDPTGMVVGDNTTTDSFIWVSKAQSNGLRFRPVGVGTGNNNDYTTGHDTNFHHWVVVSDGIDTIRVYRDKMDLGTRTPSGGADFDIKTVGSGYTGTDQLFDGQLDDLAIFDVALSATQVTNLYDGDFSEWNNNSQAGVVLSSSSISTSAVPGTLVGVLSFAGTNDQSGITYALVETNDFASFFITDVTDLRTTNWISESSFDISIVAHKSGIRLSTNDIAITVTTPPIGFAAFQVAAEAPMGTFAAKRPIGSLLLRAGHASPVQFSVSGGRDDLFAFDAGTNLVLRANKDPGPLGTTRYVEVTATNAVMTRYLQIAIEVVPYEASGLILLVR